MIRHHNEHLQLEKLFDRYAMTDATSLEEQKYYLKKKEIIFKKILRTLGMASLFYTFFVPIYFIFKKESSLSLLIKIIASLLVSTGIIAGIYFFKTAEQKPADTIPAKSAPVAGTLSPPLKKAEKKKQLPLHYTIAIQSFTSKSVKLRLRKKLTALFRQELNRIKGAGFSTMAIKTTPAIPYMLVGEIEQLHTTKVLLIKVIETETTRIIYIGKAYIRSDRETRDAIKRLCTQLIRKIKT